VEGIEVYEARLVPAYLTPQVCDLVVERESRGHEGPDEASASALVEYWLVFLEEVVALLEGVVNGLDAGVLQVLVLHKLLLFLQVKLELRDIVSEAPELGLAAGIVIEEGIVDDFCLSQGLDQVANRKAWDRHLARTSSPEGEEGEEG
jgi:hypothetical protein